MGPNLTRLFEYKRLTGIKQELKDCATYFKRIQLFEAHGEALIEALEEAFNCFLITQRVEDYPSHEWAPRVQKLLAQLEAEAQP